MPDVCWNKLAAAIGMSSLLVSACVITELKDDLEVIREDFGYLKGTVTAPNDDSDILVGLFRNDQGNLVMSNVRTVNSGETFYVLVSHADYTIFAFSDLNGDLVYQPGEPAGQVENPVINWFTNVENKERVDPMTLAVQYVELESATVIERPFDFSISVLSKVNKAAENFLRVVKFDDSNFSAENVELGMWHPSIYQEQVGYGLYVLKEFDPGKKTVLLVHGINDSPRIFEGLVGTIPDDYQILLFHYPSGFPLEYTSYALKELLGELISRHGLRQLDIVAHSMGGLVSKGLIVQADDSLHEHLHTFISISSPFGGHKTAAAGVKWSPAIAPVWWGMAPGSSYLQKIAELDLSQGPKHHLIYSYSHEFGGEAQEDDGVVSVKSQLIESSSGQAIAVYGLADTHVGIVTNRCTLALVQAILEDNAHRASPPECVDQRI
jgi:pimeloyl-ACP methyl ester carboxylesterase